MNKIFYKKLSWFVALTFIGAIKENAEGIIIKNKEENITYSYTFTERKRAILKLYDNIFPEICLKLRKLAKMKLSDNKGLIKLLIMGKPIDINIKISKVQMNRSTA